MSSSQAVPLKKVLTLNTMVFYGLGTIIGAGIYVLIGEIANEAGGWTPLAFVAAAVIASFTGLSYAELAGRYPRSAGEAVYLEQAYGQQWLSQSVGWLVVLTGLVSGATLLKGFSGYFITIFGGDPALIITLTLVALCGLACSGVKQSVGFAVAVTWLELGGLLLVLLVSVDGLLIQENWQQWLNSLKTFSWTGITTATFIAFYAFIGFEDMVNMAEEVQDAASILPKAIIIALLSATIIYVIVGLVAVVVVPATALATTSAPLMTVVAQVTWFPLWLMSGVSLIAIINGAMVQLLMAPRVIYGISGQYRYLNFLAKIHPRRQTPIVATLLAAGLIMIFALWLPLAQLAKLTSTIILCLFIAINSALITIKHRQTYSGFQVAMMIPVLGVFTASLLLVLQWVL